MTELRQAALRYANRGIPVFPLRGRGKEPLVTRGLYDASADPERVCRWWRRWPLANIGVPTGPASGWLVVDLDGPEGEASWLALEQAYGPVVTLQSRTGRGRHLVFIYPPGRELANTSGRLGPHIDTRGAGGYIVAPPSIHPTGTAYRWSQDVRQGVNGPQEPPSWLLEALEPVVAYTQPSSRQGGGCVVGAVPSGLPRHLRAQAAEAPAGDRSRQTYRLVAAALEWGLDDGQVLALAEAHAPTLEKYGARALAEVDRILQRLRPDHRHAGRPCDAASCPNQPRWMVTA